MYRDEIPCIWYSRCRAATSQIVSMLCKRYAPSRILGLSKMTSGLQSGPAEQVFNELRYEYADLFLNAGNNPPSLRVLLCYPGPLVMQEPVVSIRAALNAAGVHKNPDYFDLDDHIAVELEFMRYLAERPRTTVMIRKTIQLLRNHPWAGLSSSARYWTQLPKVPSIEASLS